MSINRFSTAQIHAGGRRGRHQPPVGFVDALGGPVGTEVESGIPCIEAVEKIVAALEGGVGSVAAASGIAALSAAVFSFIRCGQHLVLSEPLFGSSAALLKQLAPYFGINVDAAVSAIRTNGDTPANDADAYRNALKAETGLIFIETPTNPTLSVTDIAAVSAVAREAGALLVVDNTLATPYFQDPFDFGADIVTHSAASYLNGHGDVDIGFAAARKEEHLQIMRDFVKRNGTTAGPLCAYLCLRGIKTLSVRMDKHYANAVQVAEFLQLHPKIWSVYYPGLPAFEGAKIAKKQMRGFSSVISFDIKGGLEAGKQLVREVKLISESTYIGSAETLIQHPASVISSETPMEERLTAGITDELIRLSVGLEDIDDIIEDLDQALTKL
jgi:methionine-gamma-lyase